MPFKAGRLAEIWLNDKDLSAFFHAADFAAKVDMAEVSTFKSTWKSFIPGLAVSQFTAMGYFDPTQTTVRTTLQAASGVLTFMPAGAVAIGDQARLISINSTDYMEGSKTTSPVEFAWTVMSTSTVGMGVVLHTLSSDAVGTNNSTGDGVMTSTSSATGAIATLHVSVYTSGASSVKLQDSTTLGGVYTDIAGGAFATISAVGAQRLVIPGTIRQFVRAVSTVVTNPITFGCAVART